MKRIGRGSVRILIASDVASRGIDIPGLDVVKTNFFVKILLDRENAPIIQTVSSFPLESLRQCASY